MTDHAIADADCSGKTEHVPRAAYGVHNPGPRAVDRFDMAQHAARERCVDQRLWTVSLLSG